MNYLDRLESFVERYEIIRKLVYATKEIINESILSKLNINDKVAIWGLGEHTNELLKILNIENINIVCFIDRSKGKDNLEIMRKKVIEPSAVEDYAPDSIIVSSYAFRKEISEQISKFYPHCRIIDFYNDYDVGIPFYSDIMLTNLKMYAVTIHDMYNDLRNMGYTVNSNIKEKVVKISQENNLTDRNEPKMGDYYEAIINADLENKGKIKVDFFIQFSQGWTSLESVWKAFCEDERFVPRLVQIPYIHYQAKEFNEIRDYLISLKLPFIPWYFYDFDTGIPEVVFYQSPYDTTRPLEFHLDSLYKKTRIVYIPYGLEIGGGKLNCDRQFNLFMQNNAWMTCARSARHKIMYKKYCNRGDENVIITGHPKLDAIYNLNKFTVDDHMAKITEGKRVFLWNPHFIIDINENWSTFNKFKDVMLDIFEKRKDAFLIIRPHPLLLENIAMESEEKIPGVTRFKNRISNMANVYFDTTFDYRHAFALSDALLSDTSSFLLEYLPTKKPIIYLRNSEGPGLNDDGDIVDYYYVVNSEEDIEKYVDMVISDQDPMREVRLAKIEEYLFIVDGQTGKRIKKAVLNKYLMEISELKS